MVSVIIPVYNAEKYLHKCIESILVQTYADYELLLINDGSKDNSGAICEEYATKDSRVRVFHKENGGASAARNCGLDNAIGEYICFIDADDWVDKDYLENLLPVNDESMVVCSLIYESNVSRELCLRNRKRDKECINNTLHQLLEHMAICSPCCKIMLRDIIERNNIRFDTKVSAGEDMLFVYDYFSTGLECIRTISLPLYHYNVVDNESLSHKIVGFETTEYVLDCIKERIDNLSKVYDWDSNDGYRRLICTQFNNLINYSNKKTSFFERLKYLKRTIDNPHIEFLLSDAGYLIKKKGLFGVRASIYRLFLLLLRMYYLF